VAQLSVDAVVEREHVDAHTPFAQGAGGDVAVSAVVALAAHDDSAPPVGAAHLAPNRPRHSPSGPFHEHVDRGAGRDRAPVGVPHLGGREHGAHASGLRGQPTAMATAIESVCVSERCQAETPRSSARTAAFPCKATTGAPPRRRTTSTSRSLNAPSPTPIAFITASLAPNRAASRGAGSWCRNA